MRIAFRPGGGKFKAIPGRNLTANILIFLLEIRNDEAQQIADDRRPGDRRIGRVCGGIKPL
jgi:hypothetical protein